MITLIVNIYKENIMTQRINYLGINNAMFAYPQETCYSARYTQQQKTTITYDVNSTTL